MDTPSQSVDEKTEQKVEPPINFFTINFELTPEQRTWRVAKMVFEDKMPSVEMALAMCRSSKPRRVPPPGKPRGGASQ